MLHRPHFALLYATLALTISTHAMDLSICHEGLKKLTPQEAGRATSYIGSINQAAQMLLSVLQLPKESGECDMLTSFKGNAVALVNNMPTIQSLLAAHIAQAEMPKPITLNAYSLAPQSLLEVLRTSLQEASSCLSELSSNKQAHDNATLLLSESKQRETDLSSCQLGVAYGPVTLFTQNATKFPPAVLMHKIHPLNVCLVAHSQVHGIPSHCHGTIQSIPLPLDLQSNKQSQQQLVSSIKTAVLNRLLEQEKEPAHYEKGIRITCGLMATQKFPPVSWKNGNYFLDDALIDDAVLFPKGCFAVDIEQPDDSPTHKHLISQCATYEDEGIKLSPQCVTLAGTKWITSRPCPSIALKKLPKKIVYRLCNNQVEPDSKIQITHEGNDYYLNGKKIDRALFNDNVQQLSFGISRSNWRHLHVECQQALPDTHKKGEIVNKCFELVNDEWQEITCTTAHLKGSNSERSSEPQALSDLQSPRPDAVQPPLAQRSDTVEAITPPASTKKLMKKSSSRSNKLSKGKSSSKSDKKTKKGN